MHNSALALLRPAIELALGVARRGEADDPPQPAPVSLRPYLSFARLPPAALDAARRAVERDEAFRARVAAAATEEEAAVGEAGRLWLERPDGWEASLAELTRAAPSGDDRLVHEEKRRARRRALADEAASRFEARARRAEDELEAARHESTELRRSNRSLSGELERTEAQVVSLTEARQQAVRQLKAAEATLAERALEAKRVREEVERLRAELATAQRRADVAEARAQELPPPRRDGGPKRPDPDRDRRGDRDPPLDLTRASSTVGDASLAAERLARALAELSELLAPATRTSSWAEAGGAGAEGPEPADSAGPAGRRRPERLPRGWIDDTPQAAAHLARLPGVLFLVDGYNVSKTAWPELELNAQRLRLVNAVAELRMRLGTPVEVVFDGADEGRLATRALPDSVRVTFTPVGVEADDVVLERIDEQPLERNVVVVSSDRRVKDGARERGASVLSSPTFLTLLR